MTSVVLNADHVGWIRIDITQLVNDWILIPRKNFGMSIEVVLVEDQQNKLDPHQIFGFTECEQNSSKYYIIIVSLLYVNLTRRSLHWYSYNMSTTIINTRNSSRLA